jgi:hypothetical protein
MAEPDYVTAILRGAQAAPVSGAPMEGTTEEVIAGLVSVGHLTEVGAERLRVAHRHGGHHPPGSERSGHQLPSPQFARSSRDTERRAPCGFVEDGTGAFFATVGAGLTSTMRAKVSREAHVDRLLIVPSAPGLVLDQIKVGDEEQLLASGCPVEIYSAPALTDTLPDNFLPLGPALDFIVVMRNTTLATITATIGFKAGCKR